MYKFVDPFNTENYAKIMQTEGFEVGMLYKTKLYVKQTFLGSIGFAYYPMVDGVDGGFRVDLIKIRGLLEPLSNSKFLDYTYTVHVDLTRSNDEILKAMERDKRRGIRKADELGATVYISGTEEGFSNFWNIYSATANRKNFEMRNKNLLHKLFLDHDLSKLFLVEAEKKVVGAYLILHSNELARFYYGGFLYEYRKFHPNELGHGYAINYFQELGLKVYDMGGTGKNPQPQDFKMGWGGNPVKIYTCTIQNGFRGYLLKKAMELRSKLK